MPGKQMAIDADLNAGLIADHEARARREQVGREADFYGAMDGASKFVRGDAVAGLIITAINILGGLAIGVIQEGMPLLDALATYTILTVGDGLVAQLPALITSTAAGIVVTRAASESDLSHDLVRQLTSSARPLAVAGGVLGVLSLLPGLPTLPFAGPAAALGMLAYRMRARQVSQTAAAAKAAAAAPPAGPENVDGLLPLDPLQVEVGYGLLGLVEQGEGRAARDGGGDLLDRIRVLRRQFATDMGFVVPPVRVRDNVTLGANQYAFRVRGNEVARAEVYPERFLAMNAGAPGDPPAGLEVREPTFGLPAWWISRDARDPAIASGYTVVDASTVVATHLSETIRRHAPTLLGRQEVQALLNRLRESHPTIVDTLVPGILPIGVVHRVLQRLLSEGVSIRDLPRVLEVLADIGGATKDVSVLTEHARAALGDNVCRSYLGADGVLRVLVLAPAAEATLLGGLMRTGEGEENLDPRLTQPLLEAVARAVEAAPPFDAKPVLLCPSSLRRHVRRLTVRTLPHLAVLSYAELPTHIQVQTVGTVEQILATQAV
jgi:flagellar biosynthesis protein FlhA